MGLPAGRETAWVLGSPPPRGAESRGNLRQVQSWPGADRPLRRKRQGVASAPLWMTESQEG